jgi:hypothetical protein
MLSIRVHETCLKSFIHGKMLGQAAWIQMNFISYLFEKVVMNYQKERD